MNNTQRITEIFSDEGFVNELLSQESPEDVQKLLESKDIIVSVEAIIKYKEILEKHLNGEINLGDLSEEELEEISGGLITEGLITIGLILAGTGLMLTGGAAYLVDYEKRRKGRRW